MGCTARLPRTHAVRQADSRSALVLRRRGLAPSRCPPRGHRPRHIAVGAARCHGALCGRRIPRTQTMCASAWLRGAANAPLSLNRSVPCDQVRLDLGLTSRQHARLMRTIDIDDSGRISFSEFATWMGGRPDQSAAAPGAAPSAPSAGESSAENAAAAAAAAAMAAAATADHHGRDQGLSPAAALSPSWRAVEYLLGRGEDEALSLGAGRLLSLGLTAAEELLADAGGVWIFALVPPPRRCATPRYRSHVFLGLTENPTTS